LPIHTIHQILIQIRNLSLIVSLLLYFLDVIWLPPTPNLDKALLRKFEDQFYYINYDPKNPRKFTTSNGEEAK
jgi:hypothetical protein